MGRQVDLEHFVAPDDRTTKAQAYSSWAQSRIAGGLRSFKIQVGGGERKQMGNPPTTWVNPIYDSGLAVWAALLKPLP